MICVQLILYAASWLKVEVCDALVEKRLPAGVAKTTTKRQRQRPRQTQRQRQMLKWKRVFTCLEVEHRRRHQPGGGLVRPLELLWRPANRQ